jgi:hypothetical protein
MENSIIDLIIQLEVERTQAFRLLDDLAVNEEKSIEFIEIGRIFAFNYCIEKLQELLDIQNKKVAEK